MDESRMKELIETYPITEQELITLIRTVAAEAREEGIEEMQDRLCECGDGLPPCATCRVAERLKEKA